MYTLFVLQAKRDGLDAAVACFALDVSARRVREFRERYEADRAKISNGGPPIITAGLEDWYSGPGEDSRYWRPLIEHHAARGWPERRLESLDRSSSKVVAHTPRPDTATRRAAKGLVVGYVQSGKTTNFTAVIAKLADEGYGLVIVLSGLHNGLRRQTQQRLDEELKNLSELSQARWNTLTDSSRDFGTQTQHLSAALGEDRVALVVAKKNKTILTKLARWMEGPESRRALQSTRVLIIDDEADQASVATTSINPLITRLLRAAPMNTYIGYTATPFANVFINPEDSEDLYPRDFILNLEEPQGYFGPEKLFGRDVVEGQDDGPAPDGYDMVRIVPDDDLPLLRPARKDAATFEPTATPELIDAVHWFWLATAARRARGDKDHSTMLVHTVVDTVVHQAYRPLFASLQRQALEGVQDRNHVWDRMRDLWEREADRVPAGDWGREQNTWAEIEAYLEQVIGATRIVLDNSKSKDRLNYNPRPEGEDDQDDAVVAIAVGANTLSRGLTLEGLVSSFFVRNANAYDTLLQMGRWFGFRPGYQDLPRLWTTRELRDYFRHLASVETQMREEIERYQHENLTPTDVAVRIQTHPSLRITAKMGAAQRAFVSYAGRRLQTRFFPAHDGPWLAANKEAAARLLQNAALRGEHEPPPDATAADAVHLFRDVPVDVVRGFLRSYQVHEDSPDLDTALIDDYIDKQVNAEHPTLLQWTVAVIDGPRAAVPLGPLTSVGTVVRSRLEDQNPVRADIKTLMSKEDRIVDLGLGLDAQDVRKNYGEELLGRMRDDDPVHRERGLLVLYPIEARSEPRSQGQPTDPTSTRKRRTALDAVDTVIGLGLVFPGEPTLRNRITAEYVQVSLADVVREDVEDVLNQDTENDPS